MADQKISAMPSAATLTGAELVPLVQSGANVKSTLSNLTTFTRGNAGAFQSNVTQTGSTTVGTVFTFNSVDYADGVTLVSGSQLTVPVAGTYNLQFSAQFQTTDTQPQDINVWLRLNGTDIAGSNGLIGMPARKNPSDPFHGIYGWNYFVTMTAGQYLQLVWLPTATTVTCPAYASSASPAYPSTASIIATVQQVA
jgi:hypothetical protein